MESSALLRRFLRCRLGLSRQHGVEEREGRPSVLRKLMFQDLL
jgi:hypothetical protein